MVESAPIDDEQGKVHLNYASQSLLRYLMVECGIADATANTLATNIVTYRGSSLFDTVEEVQQVSGMTTAYYDLIKNYVTVYSWVNPNVQRTTGSRAPININTAPLQVLQAVFDPLGLGATRPCYAGKCDYNPQGNNTVFFHDQFQSCGYQLELCAFSGYADQPT